MFFSTIIRTFLRIRQIISTSRRIVIQQGLTAFILQSWRWITGQRGYFRTLAPDTLSYAEFIARQQNQITNIPLFLINKTVLFYIVILVDEWIAFERTWASVQQQKYSEWLCFSRFHVAHPRYLPLEMYPPTGTASAHTYTIFLENGDLLAPDALHEIAYVIQNLYPDCLYTDEDYVDESGMRVSPWFKPDWSPELLLSVDYLHPKVIRSALVDDLKHDWDAMLRLSEHTQRITHIAKVLLHRSSSFVEQDTQPITDALIRRGVSSPQAHLHNGQIVVRWQMKVYPRISIIIPSRDHAAVIAACLDSLFEKTAYPDFEVLLIDTGSLEPETFAVYERWKHDPRFRLLKFDAPFNFGRVCNYGTQQSTGTLVLYLNNDTVILDSDWLSLMAQWFEIEGIGIVGAKLLYPNGKIQHAGVIVGIDGLAGNWLTYADEYQDSIFGRDDWYRNFLAVTGACLMMPRNVYDAVDGWDEAYQLAYSDVTLCLKVHQAGWRIVYTPDVRLIHHESLTHRRKLPLQDIERATAELREWVERGDPYFNPNLSYNALRPALRQ